MVKWHFMIATTYRIMTIRNLSLVISVFLFYSFLATSCTSAETKQESTPTEQIQPIIIPTPSGIISTASRGLFIQVTAAMNPGNSGGPLVDRIGAVIGVNVGRVEQLSGRPVESIAFALNISSLEDNIQALVDSRKGGAT